MLLQVLLLLASSSTTIGGNFSDFPYIQYLTHPPEIVLRPRSQQVRAGGIVAFYCIARGDPQPDILWRKNGKKLTGTQSRYLVKEFGVGGSLLRIDPVRSNRDDATYECVAENGVADAVSAEAVLTVYEAEKLPEGFPAISQAPTTRVVEIGHTAVLTCTATGSPTPRVSWIRDMLPLEVQPNGRYMLLDKSTPGALQITSSEEDDQGKYECVAENSVGTEISKSTTLYVKVRRVSPQFSIPPQSVHEVTLGSSLNLTCVAVGSPMPFVKWHKGSVELTPDEKMPVGRNVLVLESINESANYTCVAASVLGSIEAHTMVKVQSLPKAPVDLKVSEITATSVRLSWTYQGSEDIQYYVIQFKPKHTNQAYSEINGIITLYYSVRNLSPYTEYEFSVIAVNTLGRGPSSHAVTVSTGESAFLSGYGVSKYEPGSAPRNVKVRPLSSSTMVIQWDEPDTPNGQITAYKVYYTTDAMQSMTTWHSQKVDNNQLTTISDLTPHTIYTIRVQAITTIGPGPLSTPVQVKTQQGVPSQPDGLRITEVGETSITIEWSSPHHSSENIIDYELYWNDTYAKEQHHRRLTVMDSYTLTGLYPNTLYYIWLAARSQRGEGASTPAIPVRTKQYVPGAPPRNVTAVAVSSTAIQVSWLPPTADRANGRIVYYKLMFVEVGHLDSEASIITLNATEFVLDELKRWTEYRIWVLAGTSVGDGPPSVPLIVRTEEDVPGEPKDVNVITINSTAIKIAWKPPETQQRNGIIRGYHVHVQEVREENKNSFTEPLRLDVLHSEPLETEVVGLQPDTKYSIQVAAVTRKGDGDRSEPFVVKTPGGVPSRPVVGIKVLETEPTVSIDLDWSRPSQTFGDLTGYRIRYGLKDQILPYTDHIPVTQQNYSVLNLERGVEYEFRVAGINHLGVGQEGVKYFLTPEGKPTGPPVNITHRFQTPDVVVFTWSEPVREQRNGRVVRYSVELTKVHDQTVVMQKNTTYAKVVFGNLEENTQFEFRVLAETRQGPGPYSEKVIITTDKDIGRAPMSVNAVATSETSLEIWWEPIPGRSKIIGYQVFFTMTAVEDLDEWQQKLVGLTESTEVLNLEKFAQYHIAVAARTKQGLGRLSEKVTVKLKAEDVPLSLRAHDVTTHSMTLSWSSPIRLTPINYKISFDAVKEFVDSQGITQSQVVPKREILTKADTLTYTINELSPFTTYNVNVSAIPPDYTYRPPSKITVTTQMAAPQPMVKPDFYGVAQGEEIQVILPQASEEYGPISHYYLVVVPEHNSTNNKQPDQFLTEDLLKNKNNSDSPYIAAKFPQRNIPYTFHLGSGSKDSGFENVKLQRGHRYKIFVRAVVDTPQKHLYTSSPFSEYLALDMREAPPGDPPRRPNPNVSIEPDVSVNRNAEEAGVVWIVGPVISALVLSIVFVSLYLYRRRGHTTKFGDGLLPRPTYSGINVEIGGSSRDPVEMRRLNFQTPGMMSHPPIQIGELEDHIDRLKMNDNLKFSQEYESIEPGQTFTWDQSNLEVNKSKNRYANVIAYDHSRVVLPPISNRLGGDYINANYCDGYRKQNAYVATQGPLQETIGDFWRMCWELNTATIIMMTKLEERTRIKCDQYWPSGRTTETYGVINVTVMDVQELSTYAIRTFQIQKVNGIEHREIKQLQYTAWPDHGVPEHPAPFLQFVRRVRNINPVEGGPMVVHCSAGVGRTGCFIVIDSTLERIRYEKTIDIYGHVTCLRAQRNYMVQTEDQYVFIHDAVLEAISCGTTEVPARNLNIHIDKLLAPQNGLTGLSLEFKKLSNLRQFYNDCDRYLTANLPINKHKNRLLHVLPYETNRVCLGPIRGIDGSDFINASFIDGYRYKMAYIATQGPLPDTAQDLWRMLWEHNSTIVVMLCKLKELGREKCYQYWPGDRSVRFQNFIVDPIAEYNMPQYILREFKLTDTREGSSRTVRQFQFIDWPEQGSPKCGDGFIDFIGQVHKTKEQFGQNGPITVHCSAGVGRTGVFIALSVVMERMQYEALIDLFQTIRILRIQRPVMVQTEEQYLFCYRAALEYLNQFDHYAN